VADDADGLLADAGLKGSEGAPPDGYTFQAPEDLPEGVVFDEAKVEVFKETAASLNLTQDQFEGLVKWDLDRAQENTATAVEQWAERVATWDTSARSDKEIGGQNWKASMQHARAALAKYGDQDAQALLKDPSAENPNGLSLSKHPAILRMLNRIGRDLAPPNMSEGSDKAAPVTDTTTRRMFPTMFPND